MLRRVVSIQRDVGLECAVEPIFEQLNLIQALIVEDLLIAEIICLALLLPMQVENLQKHHTSHVRIVTGVMFLNEELPSIRSRPSPSAVPGFSRHFEALSRSETSV